MLPIINEQEGKVSAKPLTASLSGSGKHPHFRSGLLPFLSVDTFNRRSAAGLASTPGPQDTAASTPDAGPGLRELSGKRM